MRKIRFKPVAAIAAALAPLMAAAGVINYTATYDNSPIIGSKSLGGATYTTVAYHNLNNLGQPGTPSLPVDFIRFSVPYNASHFSITATPSWGNALALPYPMYPIQEYSVGNITPPDEAIYQAGGVFPSQLAWIVGESMAAGENHVVTVAVMPMTYQCPHGTGTSDSLRLAHTINLSLDYELSSTPEFHPIIRKDTTLRNKGFDRTREKVVNPQDVRANAAPLSNNPIISYDPHDPQVSDTITNPETYLIITTEDLLSSMRRIAAYKRQKGIRVKIVTVDDAVNDPAAGDGDYFPWGDLPTTYTDDAGKLRNYLRSQYYDKGTEYVLLAGTDVPSRERYGGQADMYFSELNANWMYSIYEENEKDGELFVGRLLGTEPQQIDNYTNKLLRYELNPGNGDGSYLRRALFTEADRYRDYTMFMKESMANTIPDTTTIHEIPDGNYPTGCDVLDSIGSNQYGFVCMYNPGFPSHIKMYGPDLNGRSNHIWALSNVKDDPSILDQETGNGLDQMNNKYYPAIGYCPINNTMSCDYDVNFGESFTMGKDYGGPVYIGMTAPSEINIGGSLSYYDFDIFSGTLGRAITRSDYTMGQAFINAKGAIQTWFWGWREMVSGLNYLGDPDVYMWTDQPQHYSNITVTRTDNGITVSGVPSNSTVVSYYNNDGAMGKCMATTSTVTISDASPNSTIMLHRHNSIPYIAPLVLQNTTLDKSQYVIASDVTAGKTVDSGRTSGQVTVTGNIDYEIEHTGEVRFEGGFRVDKGVKFAVRPSIYDK